MAAASPSTDAEAMPGAPWMLNAHACAGLALFAAAMSALLNAVQRIGVEYGLSTRQIGTLLGSYFLCFFVSSVFGGVLSPRVGMKRVLAAGYAFTVLGLSCFAVSTGAPLLALSVMAIGLGGGILEGMTTSLLLSENPRRTRHMVALSQLFYCVGALAGTALVGLLFAGHHPWRTAFLALLVPALLLGLLLFMLRIRPTARAASTQESGAAARWILVFAGLLFLFVYVETGLTSWIPFLLATTFQLPEPQPQWVFSAFWVFFLAARLILSFAHLAFRASTFTVLAFALLLVPLAALCLPIPLPALFAAVALCGLFASPLWILIVTWANEHVSPAQASLVVGAGGLAAGSSPFISAPVIEHFGARGHFVVLGCVSAFALLSALLLRRKAASAMET